MSKLATVVLCQHSERCCAGLKAKDIDILVVNCSLFNPTPSLSAMIVNHFKMRPDVISYNLAGASSITNLTKYLLENFIKMVQYFLVSFSEMIFLVQKSHSCPRQWQSVQPQTVLLHNKLQIITFQYLLYDTLLLIASPHASITASYNW